MANEKVLLFGGRQDKTLIEWVAKFPSLYDSESLSYKNQRVKDNAWQEVAEHVDRSIEDCKKRWRNIKDTYNKRKKKGKGTGSQTKPWSLASLLGFLDKVEHTRPSTSNVNEGEDPLLLDEEELTAGVDEGTSDVPADLKTPSTSTTQKRPSFPFGDSAPTPKKSKQSAEILELLQTSRADCCRILDSLQNREDDVDVFFRSIALSVKKLRPQLVNEAKMRSLQMVFELEQQNDNVPVPQPSPAESTSTSSFLHSETVVKNELNPVAALT